MGEENAQHIKNLLANARGVKKVLRNAVLKGAVSATTSAMAGLADLSSGSCSIANTARDNSKYPTLTVQVNNG